MKKLRSSRGETLVETMAAMVIVVLAGLLFLQMTTASGTISSGAAGADGDYEAALATVEQRTAPAAPGSVTVTDSAGVTVETYPVTRYTAGAGDRSLTAYDPEGSGG